ncbi:ser/Thr protein phosphatase-like protein family [Plenodomus tracheiphilus IPT5]|uniref:Ser/Thr protein phosphatase-like protein family n=1 Tax=Plenodomus tracheiphilus IPT5 TaxID=1408161 RepID=A0A6A7AQF1_9PLEO|nr:ser/Thr protein phosphatase-like protein family [Plenodomus tracheiphilus IPT5]
MTRREPTRAHQRPLLDLIPDHRHDVDASDEEADFYGPDDDFLTPLKWQAALTRTTERIPRRVRRSPKLYAALAFLALVAWLTYLGPRFSAYRHQMSLMNNTPAMRFGNNAQPAFKGMIQVRDMDQQHLPEKHKHKRLVFVGDVHGCRNELEHLLNKVGFDHKRDHLVLTGDMIAKGPDSPGVIKLAREMGASCVRGNWEDKLLLSIAEAQDNALATPDTATEPSTHHPNAVAPSTNAHASSSLHKLAKEFSKGEIAFLQECPVILRVGTLKPNLGTFVAVHAGLVPDTPLERQDPFHVMNMRTIDLKTRIPSSKHSGTPWEKLWNHRQEKLPRKDRVSIVYGHNRKKGLNIRKYSYGLDTGCVSGGRLTALVVDGEGETELVHVKCGKEGGYDAE